MNKLEEKIFRLEGQLMVHRAFIALALSKAESDLVEEVFDNPAMVKFFVDNAENSKIPHVVSEGYRYEKALLRKQFDKFKNSTPSD